MCRRPALVLGEASPRRFKRVGMGKRSENNKPIHGQGHLAEFTLCGLAFEGELERAVYGGATPTEADLRNGLVRFAQPGEMITCDDCRRVIDLVRNGFKRYRCVEQ